MNRTTRRLALVPTLAIVGAFTAVAAAGPAAADNKNTGTLDATCSDGSSPTFSLTSSNGAFPSALHVVGTNSTFTIHQITLVPHDGSDPIVVKNVDGVAHNQALVSCTHVGNNFDFIWVGFFT